MVYNFNRGEISLWYMEKCATDITVSLDLYLLIIKKQNHLLIITGLIFNTATTVNAYWLYGKIFFNSKSA